MGYFPVRYDTRVVIYERKIFIRLATGFSLTPAKFWRWSIYGMGQKILSVARKFSSFGKISVTYRIVSVFRGQNEMVRWMVEILQVLNFHNLKTALLVHFDKEFDVLNEVIIGSVKHYHNSLSTFIIWCQIWLKLPPIMLTNFLLVFRCHCRLCFN